MVFVKEDHLFFCFLIAFTQTLRRQIGIARLIDDFAIVHSFAQFDHLIQKQLQFFFGRQVAELLIVLADFAALLSLLPPPVRDKDKRMYDEDKQQGKMIGSCVCQECKQMIFKEVKT